MSEDFRATRCRFGAGQASANISLSGLAQTVDGENIQIRIQPFTSNSDPGVMTAYQNIAFNGSAIPEPSSAALLGRAGLGLLVRRRR